MFSCRSSDTRGGITSILGGPIINVVRASATDTGREAISRRLLLRPSSLLQLLPTSRASLGSSNRLTPFLLAEATMRSINRIAFSNYIAGVSSFHFSVVERSSKISIELQIPPLERERRRRHGRKIRHRYRHRHSWCLLVASTTCRLLSYRGRAVPAAYTSQFLLLIMKKFP